MYKELVKFEKKFTIKINYSSYFLFSSKIQYGIRAGQIPIQKFHNNINRCIYQITAVSSTCLNPTTLNSQISYSRATKIIFIGQDHYQLVSVAKDKLCHWQKEKTQSSRAK